MLRNLGTIGVLTFPLDNLRAESGGVSNIKGSAISTGQTRGVIFILLGIFYCRVVRGVAGNFLLVLVEFELHVARSVFVEVSLVVFLTTVLPLVSVAGIGSGLERTTFGFIVD